MTANELNRLAKTYNKSDGEISAELLTILKNAANAGKFSVSLRDISNDDYYYVKRNGFTIKTNPENIDQPYTIYWD